MCVTSLYPSFNYEYFYSIQFTFLRPSKAVKSRCNAQWVLAFTVAVQYVILRNPISKSALGVSGVSAYQYKKHCTISQTIILVALLVSGDESHFSLVKVSCPSGVALQRWCHRGRWGTMDSISRGVMAGRGTEW